MPLYLNGKDLRMQRILSNCSVICGGSYKPPWWCRGPWMNLLISVIKEKINVMLWPMEMERETIIADDGGEISIDWADDITTKNLPEGAPVLGILHPLTGDSWNQSGFMQYAASKGWRSCVLNRHGHSGMRLRVIPHFSIMGNVDDTCMIVERMRKRYPNNFLALAGVSAGSGQLVSYIGREGANAKVDAAASLCPAWDLSESFDRLYRQHPWLDWYLTRNVIRYFLGKPVNTAVLSTMQDTVNDVSSAGNLVDFVNAAAPLAGCRDLQHFFKENNPMNYILGNQTPCLVLNALDDFLCVKENIRVDLKDKIFNFVLLVTDEGGHISYNESGGGNYMWRTTLEFFEAVRNDSEN